MTPGGKLQRGDIIISPKGEKYEVQERRGNDISYSVYIWRLGDPSNHIRLLTEAGWWITKGGWKYESM
jgi:hypothetical protein